mmetsp:Transcript_318/g.582  ORF Transcript_318/g.582 Transcript_318/m.582 type:complete len:163 (+) Transcript_318:1083-1571(+)
MNYEKVFKEIESVIQVERNRIANMANVASICFERYNEANAQVNWFGFYLVDKVSEKKELVLGPFHGTVACTRIRYGKGVCGSCWQQDKALVVPNVHEFKGHIACDSRSESEIVVPLYDAKNQFVGLIDVDSLKRETFSDDDVSFLTKVAASLKEACDWHTAI